MAVPLCWTDSELFRLILIFESLEKELNNMSANLFDRNQIKINCIMNNNVEMRNEDQIYLKNWHPVKPKKENMNYSL